MTDQSGTTTPTPSRTLLPGSVLRDPDHDGPLIAVPVEVLSDLLGAWSALTAGLRHDGPDDEALAEGDEAFDVLSAAVAEVLS